LHEDLFYCGNCYYFIAIDTVDVDAVYEIGVRHVNAALNYTHFITMGEPKMAKFEKKYES
jgi:hypothetical protein